MKAEDLTLLDRCESVTDQYREVVFTCLDDKGEEVKLSWGGTPDEQGPATLEELLKGVAEAEEERFWEQMPWNTNRIQ